MADPERLTFEVCLNPLAFLKVDPALSQLFPEPLNLEDVLEYATGSIPADGPSYFAARYRRISAEKPRLFAAPAEDRILRRIVHPLRFAKACYMLGAPLATVALCGLVAEMLAVMLWEAWRPDIPVGERPRSEKEWKNVLGMEFERLGQERRVRLLRFFGIITDVQEQSFNRVRTVRNGYLHAFSKGESTLDADAIKVFCETESLVAQFFARIGSPGSIALAPQIIRYLRECGIVSSVEQTPSTSESSGHQSDESASNPGV